MLKGLYILNKEYQDLVYPDFIKKQIKNHVRILTTSLTQHEIMEHKERDFGSVLGKWLKQPLFCMFSDVSNSQIFIVLHANCRFDIIGE